MVNKVHTETLIARTASNALKESMQSNLGERIVFKDEDIREKLHKQAKLNHQSDIKKQIQEKQKNKIKQKVAKMSLEKQWAK